MKTVHIDSAMRPEGMDIFATRLLDGEQSNVRIIRLAPGQTLPPHRHGSSDLMLFAAAGDGVLDTTEDAVAFGSGSLAFFRGDEELRVRNSGVNELTLLAFLAPKFPPSS